MEKRRVERMKEKFLIRFENEAIALQYDFLAGEITMAGSGRIRSDIEMVLEVYFGMDLGYLDPKFLPRRKLLYRMKMKKPQYDAGLKKLQENGLVEPVNNFGRIIR